MNPYLELTRPNVCVLSIFGLIVGLLLVNIPYEFWTFPILAAFLICASGNVINDYFDFEIDRVNKPDRPIPAGKISEKRAIFLYLILAVSGLAFSFLTSVNFLILAIINTAITFIYSFKLKTTILGNFFDTYLAVSLFIAPVLIFNGFIDILYSPTLIVASIIFFANYGREVLKDVEDMKGDKMAGAKTLPIVIGKNTATVVGKVMVFIGACLLFLPYLTGVFTGIYLLFAIFSFGFCLAVLKIADAEKLQKMIKVLMFIVIIFFLISAVLLKLNF